MDLQKQDSATRDDLGMLAVMDVLADQEQVSQRELSRRTGLNLKKVNYCLHKLLEKGHIKFQRAVNNPDKRVYLYILTPAGLKAKSHLTYRFLKYTLDFYNQVDVKLRQSLRDMARSGVKKIILCGASDAAKIVLELVECNGIEVVGIVDQDHPTTSFAGQPLMSIKKLESIEWDGVLITALDGLEELESSLRNQGLDEESIWRLS